MNAPAPLVSIILATYNGAQYLEQQLQSLVDQTYAPLEIVVVDDGSTDATWEVLQDWAARYPLFRLHRNTENLGYIRNFEKGCALARGAYLSLCDQDDAWHPQKTEKLVRAIGPHALVHCDSFLCDAALQPTGRRISDNAVLMPIHSPLQQAVFCRVYGHASLFTRTLFEASRPFLPIIPHDWWLCYGATFHGGIQYLPEPLVYYRQHASNLYGAVGTKRKKTRAEKEKQRARDRLQLVEIRQRVAAFRVRCPDSLVHEKKVLAALSRSYESFSLPNNWRRMMLFFQYGHLFLAVKKRSPLRKWLFCLKMFFIIK